MVQSKKASKLLALLELLTAACAAAACMTRLIRRKKA